MKTRESSGWQPVMETLGSRGKGSGGSKVVSSFLGSLRYFLRRWSLRGRSSREKRISLEIFDSTVMSSPWRRSVLRRSGPPGAFINSVMKSNSTLAKSLRCSLTWSGLRSSHSTIKYQWRKFPSIRLLVARDIRKFASDESRVLPSCGSGEIFSNFKACTNWSRYNRSSSSSDSLRRSTAYALTA